MQAGKKLSPLKEGEGEFLRVGVRSGERFVRELRSVSSWDTDDFHASTVKIPWALMAGEDILSW